MKIFSVFMLCVASIAMANSAPKLDKKMKADDKMKKCADWASGEVGGVSDKKEKASKWKDLAQKCSSVNGLPTHWVFSGKFKP